MGPAWAHRLVEALLVGKAADHREVSAGKVAGKKLALAEKVVLNKVVDLTR